MTERTAKEALLAEALGDLAALLDRLELLEARIHETMGRTLEEAVQKGALPLRLSLQEAVSVARRDLLETARDISQIMSDATRYNREWADEASDIQARARAWMVGLALGMGLGAGWIGGQVALAFCGG